METCRHFFFECPVCCLQRTVLYNNLTMLRADVNARLNLTIDSNEYNVIAPMLICGLNLPNSEYNDYINLQLFKLVSQFITSTCRFNRNTI